MGNNVNSSSSGLKLRSASGADVEHFGTTSVRDQLGNQAYDSNFEEAVVSGPIASWLEDAGWTFRSVRGGRKLRRGQEQIEVLRLDGVCWIRVDDAGNAETAHSLLKSPRYQPDRSVKRRYTFVDDSTRSAHRIAHLPPRSWFDHCVKGFATEDHRRRRDWKKATIPEIQLDYMFLGGAAVQDST